MLGVPPLMGFLGRWRLYEAALQIHPALAAVFILSSIFALDCVRAGADAELVGSAAAKIRARRQKRELYLKATIRAASFCCWLLELGPACCRGLWGSL